MYSCSAFSTPYLPSPRYLSVYALFLICSLCSCSYSVHNLSDHCSFCWCTFTLQFFSTPCFFITVYHFTLISYSILWLALHYLFVLIIPLFSSSSLEYFSVLSQLIFYPIFELFWEKGIRSIQFHLSDFQFQVSLFYFWRSIFALFTKIDKSLLCNRYAIWFNKGVHNRKILTIIVLFMCENYWIRYPFQHLASS